VWAALYEGEYTANTLPMYLPKGYGAELVECRRYYMRYTNIMLYATVNDSTKANAFLFLPQQMRDIPTVSVITNGVSGNMMISDGSGELDVPYSADYKSRDYFSAQYKANHTGACVNFVFDTVELSADL
jgi:hypothetical protein